MVQLKPGDRVRNKKTGEEAYIESIVYDLSSKVTEVLVSSVTSGDRSAYWSLQTNWELVGSGDAVTEGKVK